MTPKEFNEAVKAVVASQLTPLIDEIRSLKADLIEIKEQNARTRNALSTGKGLQKNDDKFSPDELKALLPARLESESLETCALIDAARHGIDVRNSAELERWLTTRSEVKDE